MSKCEINRINVKSCISRSSISRSAGTEVHEKHHRNVAAGLSRQSTNLEQKKTKWDVDVAEEEHNEDIFSLDYLRASIFATILEDFITELRILDECNSELSIIKTMADMEHLRALKYSVKQPAHKDELDGIEMGNLGKMEYKLNKLVGDRKFLTETLINVYLDLSLRKNWKAIADKVNEIIDKEVHYEYLIEEEIKNKATRREIMRQLRQQSNHIKSVVYENEVTIEDLKRRVEDATLNADIRSRYFENWQRARTEQHHQTITLKETGHSQVIEYYKQRSDIEQRVHSEVEMLTNIAISETLEKVETWMIKYAKDMDNLDLKIQIKKLDYQSARDKRIELEETIAKHDEMMRKWIKFKEEREIARQYREKMNKSAIIVQAWWRGLLVRLQLGPYTPKKKGKTGGKKK